MKGMTPVPGLALALCLFSAGCTGTPSPSPQETARLYDEAQQFLTEKRDPAAALTRLDLALGHQPEHAPSLNLRAAVHRILGNTEAAIEDYRRLLPMLPDDPAPRYNLALLLNEQNRPEEAETILTGALDLFPSFIQAMLLRSEIRSRLGREEEAREDLENARKAGSHMANVFHNRGIQHAAARRMADALHAFNLCLQLDPDHFQGRLARGNLFMKRGEHEAALAEFDHADNLFPDTYDVLIYRGTCLIQMERYQDAHRVLSRAVTIEPNRTHAWMLRGILHANVRDEPGRAEEDFRRVLAIDDQSDEAHEALGLLYQNQELLDQAERELLLALGIRSNPERLHLLSGVYRAKDNLSAAAEALRIAVKSCQDKNYRDRLQKELDEIEATLSRPEEPSKESDDEPKDPR